MSTVSVTHHCNCSGQTEHFLKTTSIPGLYLRGIPTMAKREGVKTPDLELYKAQLHLYDSLLAVDTD